MKRVVLLLALFSATIFAETPLKAPEGAPENTEPAAGTTTTQPNVTMPLPQQRIFDQDLNKYLPASEIAWLSEKEARFLTLWSEQTSASPVGVSWIFADSGCSANNPNFIQSLRYQLNDKGLHTYSISPFSEVNMADETAKASRHKQLEQRIKVLQDKIVNQDGKRLIIAQGRSAIDIIDIIANNAKIQPDAVVIIGAYTYDQKSLTKLNQQIAQLKLPVLDLYHRSDNETIIKNAKLRKVESRRDQKSDYRLTEIISLGGSPDAQQETSQAIYGWLTSLGWY